MYKGWGTSYTRCIFSSFLTFPSGSCPAVGSGEHCSFGRQPWGGCYLGGECWSMVAFFICFFFSFIITLVIIIGIVIIIIPIIIVVIVILITRSVFHHLLAPQSNGLFRAGLANSGTMISGLADRWLRRHRHQHRRRQCHHRHRPRRHHRCHRHHLLYQVNDTWGGGRKWKRICHRSKLPPKARDLATGKGDFLRFHSIRFYGFTADWVLLRQFGIESLRVLAFQVDFK